MPVTIKIFFATIASAILFLSFNHDPQRHLGRGEQWLSWNKAERNVYVDGFISGYLNGSHKACLATNDLFEIGKPHRLGEDPSARCSARVDTYSKYRDRGSANFSAYTDVLTEFYSKHPEHRGIPFVYLLSLLNDRQYKTADQLYEMAKKGELRTNF